MPGNRVYPARRNFKGSRRLTQWFRAADASAYFPLAAATAVIDQNLANITEPITVIRMRGMISVKSDQTAARETPFGACGACVVSDQALAVGVTAVPTPISDKDSDLWLMHQYFFAEALPSEIGGTQFSTYAFDSKAMRKIPEGTTLTWMVENASAGFGLEYLLQFAVLIKLA